jgi:hypothetical protein
MPQQPLPLGLLSPCPVQGCDQQVLSLLYLGLDPQQQHLVGFTCAGGHNGIVTITIKPAAAGKLIPRSPTFPPERGTWFKTPEGNVILSCPRCGKIAGVNAPVHSVDPLGAVKPSWVCPFGCGYHEFITLQDQREGSHAYYTK